MARITRTEHVNKYDRLKQKARDLAQQDGTPYAIVDMERGDDIKLALVTIDSVDLDAVQGGFITHVHEVIE